MFSLLTSLFRLSVHARLAGRSVTFRGMLLIWFCKTKHSRKMIVFKYHEHFMCRANKEVISRCHLVTLSGKNIYPACLFYIYGTALVSTSLQQSCSLKEISVAFESYSVSCCQSCFQRVAKTQEKFECIVLWCQLAYSGVEKSYLRTLWTYDRVQ